MQIKNEDHAKEMLQQWQTLPIMARKKEIRLAIEKLELSSMYYEQKGNDKGVQRAERCRKILSEHLDSLA